MAGLVSGRRYVYRSPFRFLETTLGKCSFVVCKPNLSGAQGHFPKVDDFSSLFPKVDDSQARPPSVSPGQLHSRTLRHRLLRSHRARLVARKSPSCPPLMFVGRVGATFLLLLPPSPELPSYQHSHTRHSRSTLQRRSLCSPRCPQTPLLSPPSCLLAESVPLFCSFFHLPLNYLRSNIHTPAILGQHYSDAHCARLQNVDRVGAALRSLIVELPILHNYPAHAVVRSSTKAIIRPRLFLKVSHLCARLRPPLRLSRKISVVQHHILRLPGHPHVHVPGRRDRGLPC